VGETRSGKTAALAEVNRCILDAARDSISEEQEWEFFCECGRPDCREHVTLTIDAYVAIRDGGGAVVADGHRPSQVERARRLAEDAEALRRQAQHQLNRAEKNIRARTS
jgi:hypothetical protein